MTYAVGAVAALGFVVAGHALGSSLASSLRPVGEVSVDPAGDNKNNGGGADEGETATEMIQMKASYKSYC